jgi:uroporphyrin-III C-methyltransferase / precorrin-2 dehydrogenase / sirohydrochlorin ferrochelatase
LRKPLEPKTARTSGLARLPVFFALTGKRALLAGDSAAVAWMAELLSGSGSHGLVSGAG